MKTQQQIFEQQTNKRAEEAAVDRLKERLAFVKGFQSIEFNTSHWISQFFFYDAHAHQVA